tara:strand:+ start:1829 stop:2098 length:270 start_codon:yes stop_codon:yes gene_type:complete
MKIFIYKTLIVVFFVFILFEFTIGSKIKKFENKIENFSSKQERQKTIDKVRKEIQRANNKENILSLEDRKLISKFINKIIKELDIKNQQ